MLLHIVARGRIGRSPEAELVDRYLKRVSFPTRVTELPDTGGKMPAEITEHCTDFRIIEKNLEHVTRHDDEIEARIDR